MSRVMKSGVLFLLIMALILPATAVGQAVAEKEKKAKAKKKRKESAKTEVVVPVFSMNSAILESPMADDPFFGSIGAEPLKDLVARLEKARDDEDVKAIILLIGTPQMGQAQLEELHGKLMEIRKAGKSIYAYADHLSFGQLALASAATRISVAPVGELFINGLYGQQLHLRSMLEKIHVTPDFLTCGKYKSAAELFMRSKPSAEAEEMYNWLFDSLYDSFVRMIAEGRGVSEKTVHKWVDKGMYSSAAAAKLGIIDASEFRPEFMQLIEGKHGEELKLARKYGKKSSSSIDLSSPVAMFQIWAEILKGSSKSRSKKDAVAVVYVEGPIVPGRPEPSPFGSQGTAYSDPIRKALDEAAEDDTVKAVVLRVNSPGGSAVASEIIMQATRRVAEEKPFVVSMGDVAGSGGYYVACGADTIFADASTITGSIGVVAGKLVTDEMWNAIGVNWHPIQRGENADIFGSSEKFSDDQRELLQSWMDEIYDDFKGHVLRIRGDRLKKPIDELAGGRVYTGEQALELGLIDRVGTFGDAVDFVAEKADLDDYIVRVIPRPKNFIEAMMSELSDGDDDDPRIGIAAGWRTRAVWQAALPLLESLQPQRASALRRALLQLEILQRESVSLMMPELVLQ